MSDIPAAAGAALRQGSVLGVLEAGAIDRLVATGSAVDLPPGAVLFEAGDQGDAAFVVLSGELEIRTQSPDGRDVRIGGLGVGALVGEMAVFDGAPRSATAVGQRRTQLWRIPRAAFLAALEADPRAALALLAELSRRLRAVNTALESSRLLDLGGRLAQLLEAEGAGRASISMTQTEMARRLGHSREKVNRKLNQWVRAGWIEIGRSGLKVIEPQRLAEQALVR